MSPTVVIALAILFAGMGLLAYGVVEIAVRHRYLLRRLGIEPAKRTGIAREPDRLVKEDQRLKSIERFLRPGDIRNLSQVQKRLVAAGYGHQSAVGYYYASKWGIATLGVVGSSYLLPRLIGTSHQLMAVAAVIAASLASVFAIDIWLTNRIAHRREEIEDGLPDALDLLLVCVEAGQGLDQAFVRVAREMRSASPTLAGELSTLVAELAAGKVRAQALGDLAARTGVTSVASLTTVLKQADKFGVSVSDTLRVYAQEMRDKRLLRAEERANMMPTKLAISTALLTLYPLLTIVIGPAVIAIFHQLNFAR